MRVKKQKRNRKAVRYYSACFGFREPFKVLCDGTFIHHLLIHRLTPADDALRRLLATPVTLFATKCIVAELRSLGSSHVESLNASQQLLTARCEHEKRVNAATCIEEVIGDGNTEHFFVATQDADLRKKLQQIPGVPLIYGVKNSLSLEKPSVEDRKFVKLLEEKRLHVNVLEAKMLRKRNIDMLTPVGNDKSLNEKHETDDVASQVERRKRDNKRKHQEIAEKWQFKRNIAKGPNPLSCKKKKKTKDNSEVAANNDGESPANKKKRNRKRRKVKSSAGPLE